MVLYAHFEPRRQSIIQQFAPKSKKDWNLNEATNELLLFADNIEFEDEELAGRDGDREEDDNVEGWIDECLLMTEQEVEKLDDSVALLCLLLTKVSY